ncbi:MAG: hypothetical protein HC880_02545 [Bacteroidia bacterium]|nr:hypothetical protein [Bacteroidia bacterium]
MQIEQIGEIFIKIGKRIKREPEFLTALNRFIEQELAQSESVNTEQEHETTSQEANIDLEK